MLVTNELFKPVDLCLKSSVEIRCCCFVCEALEISRLAAQQHIDILPG